MKKDDLKHIAKLSRIKLSGEEIEKFSSQMETILESVKTLDEVDTDGVKVRSLRRTTLSELREDTVKPSLLTQEALKNAPYSKDNYVKVYGSLTDDSGA